MQRSLVRSAVAAVLSLTLATSTTAHAQQSRTEQRLLQLIGRWVVTASTFGMPTDGSAITFTVEATAGGRAVRSLWVQGTGSSRYEASALWAFSTVHREVRVMEANTLGVAEMHTGRFDDAGVLRIELRDTVSARVRERRAFTWKGDTLYMTATFVRGDRTIKHQVTMLRRP